MKDKLKSSSLSSTLKSLVEQLGELNDIHQKSIESGRGSADTMVYKAMEDGILDNIHNATNDQINKLKTYKFKYYSELNDDDVLLAEIRKRLRDRKLEELGI